MIYLDLAHNMLLAPCTFLHVSLCVKRPALWSLSALTEQVSRYEAVSVGKVPLKSPEHRQLHQLKTERCL